MLYAFKWRMADAPGYIFHHLRHHQKVRGVCTLEHRAMEDKAPRLVDNGIADAKRQLYAKSDDYVK